MVTERPLGVVNEVRVFAQEVATHELHDDVVRLVEQTTHSIDQLSVSTFEHQFQRSTGLATDGVERHGILVLEEVIEVIGHVLFKRCVGNRTFAIEALRPRQLFNHDFVQVEVNLSFQTLHT
ncbi:hypothetical protein D3C71_617160 [compost metagenome]